MDKWFRIRFSLVLIIFYSIFVTIGAILGYIAQEDVGPYIGILIGASLTRALSQAVPGFFLFFERLLLRFLRLFHSHGKFIITIVVLSVIGAGLIFHHDNTYNEIGIACSMAETASTLEQRKTFLKKGFDASKFFGLFIPEDTMLFGKRLWGRSRIEECEEVQTQLSIMLEYGVCSDYILEDVPCQCGLIDWTPGDFIASCTSRNDLECTTNPTTDEDVIGCF